MRAHIVDEGAGLDIEISPYDDQPGNAAFVGLVLPGADGGGGKGRFGHLMPLVLLVDERFVENMRRRMN